MSGVDQHVLAADHGALAHAARYYSRVAGHTAARRDYRLGSDYAVKVLGRRFLSDQDHVLAAAGSPLGFIRIEDRDATRRARTGRDV